jgi:Ni/Fe-hydrogenase subunit HybB-like protein
MSLEPHWFSTIYGVMFIVGQVLAALALMILMAVLLADREPLSNVVSPAYLLDLGNLLLAFVMFWAYMAFSQYIVIWSGNLPEEITWYLHRTTGGWQWIALFLIIFHFAVPFLLLLSRVTKRSVQMLSAVAAALIVIRLVDLFWLVVPAFHHTGVYIHWMDLAAPIGVGGIWIWFFIWQLKGRSLLPLHDPRLPGILGHARSV